MNCFHIIQHKYLIVLYDTWNFIYGSLVKSRKISHYSTKLSQYNLKFTSNHYLTIKYHTIIKQHSETTHHSSDEFLKILLCLVGCHATVRFNAIKKFPSSSIFQEHVLHGVFSTTSWEIPESSSIKSLQQNSLLWPLQKSANNIHSFTYGGHIVYYLPKNFIILGCFNMRCRHISFRTASAASGCFTRSTIFIATASPLSLFISSLTLLCDLVYKQKNFSINPENNMVQ